MVRAYWLLLGRAQPGSTYNAASGKAVSIQEVIDGFLARAARPIEVRQVRPARSPRRHPAAARATRAGCGRSRAGPPPISFQQSLEDVLDDWRHRG